MGNSFSCKICLNTKCKWKRFNNKDRCGHSFCKECITMYIISKVHQDVSYINCPHFGCNVPLNSFSCKTLLSHPVYSRWRNLILQLNTNQSNSSDSGAPNAELDPAFTLLALSRKWQRCPRCKFFVERASGCSFISCRCGMNFCYKCGRQTQRHDHSVTCQSREGILANY